ncbi:mitochondrial metalloendopeptidase OMA1-like [Bidens hawaiensis]|uniref:mitochondrial metalloendopeptidase OMA1-like n=1 Tax=Bidens hawaiensis TaxID=980011 RepID=UPI00404A8326
MAVVVMVVKAMECGRDAGGSDDNGGSVVGGVENVLTPPTWHYEQIPYSKRKHFMLISGKIETWVGEYSFENMKDKYKGCVLPDTHPKSVRVRTIMKDVTEALQTGLNKQDLNHGHDKRVKLGISHAKGLEWEIIVVKSNDVNAYCLPGGKIIVFTGLLERFKANEELATIIGHEVAHAVARHAAEKFVTLICFTIGRVILDGYIQRDVVSASYIFLLNLPFSRKMEMEADHIGLMLMASAGYNPRVAPKVFEKLDEESGDSALENFLSTHPSGKERSKLLSEARVMQEAISIYQETIARRELVDT